MYTVENFQTKKALKDAVKSGAKVTVFRPNSMFAPGPINDECANLEGPHYPQPHKWYAEAVVENSVIVKVK